jgi:hypothetical protein
MTTTKGGVIVNDLPAVEQLDAMLEILYDKFDPMPLHGIPNALKAKKIPHFKRNPQIAKDDSEWHIKRIVRKLVKDGYVDEPEEGDNGYSITFEGVVFKEEGGYRHAQKVSQTNHKRKKAEIILLNTASVFAGFGATGLFLIETLRHYSWIGLINFWTCLFVFFAGIIAGTIIYQIIQHQLERKE